MNKELNNFNKRQLIYKDFVDIVESLELIPLTKSRIERHKKYINSFNISGKVKYKTYNLLTSYYNTNFKNDALIGLYIFSKKKYLI